MHSAPELLSEFLPSTGRIRILLRGGSMHPFLQDGDILEIDSQPSELKKGDIVVFKQNGFLFAHRIVNIIGSHVETQGDAISRREKLVRSDILGKVTTRIRSKRSKDLQAFAARFYASTLPWSRTLLRVWNLLLRA